MASKISQLVNELMTHLNLTEEDLEVDFSTREEAFRAVEEAKREWLNARVYFDNVVDPDLIDHAIYTMDAAEKKYMYLLKQAKGFQRDLSQAT